MAHPNVELLQRFLDAYADGDREALEGLLSPDAVWHVGGTNRLSGDYRGRDAILEYFDTVQRETDGTLTLHPVEVLANDRRGAVFLRVTAEREGRMLDVAMAEAFLFAGDGSVQEFWAHAADQAAVDGFWDDGEQYG
ncbi:MAG TPA: nuclear transport factor 2 family protein [Nitriliruptorales bacterium]|nr:nuclear transport factor 2 family protein [Nitriliruptorales bacterium]